MQGLERLVGGHPYVVARLLVDDSLHPAVDVLERLTLHNSSEVFCKLLLDPASLLKDLSALLFCGSRLRRLNDFSTGGSDADGNRMEVSHLESADCIPTYTQDTVLALIGYLLHSLDTGAIEVVLVPSGFNEQVGLDVPLHLLHAGHKVVVPPVHLPITRLTSCVCT